VAVSGVDRSILSSPCRSFISNEMPGSLSLARGVSLAHPSALRAPSTVLRLPSPMLGACRHESIRRRSAKDNRKKREPKVQRVPDSRWAISPRDFVHVYNGGQKVGEGHVLKCYRPRNLVWVSGFNVRSREKVDRSDPQSVVTRTITEEAPVHYSMVNLVDPVDGKRTRLRRAYLGDGKRVRVAVRSGAVIERVPHTPKYSHEERNARPISPFTTAKEEVVRKTYVPS